MVNFLSNVFSKKKKEPSLSVNIDGGPGSINTRVPASQSGTGTSLRADESGRIFDRETSDRLNAQDSIRRETAGSIIGAEFGQTSTTSKGISEDAVASLRTQQELEARGRGERGELSAPELREFQRRVQEEGLNGEMGFLEENRFEEQLTNFDKFSSSVDTILEKAILPGVAASAVVGIGAAAGVAAGGATALGALYAVNEFVLSPSELATWAAVDNVAGQAAFLTRDLPFAVRDGSISAQEASELIAQSKQATANSRNFVDITTSRNPKLWANSKILKSAIDEADRRIELSEIQITQLQGGQA